MRNDSWINVEIISTSIDESFLTEIITITNRQTKIFVELKIYQQTNFKI